MPISEEAIPGPWEANARDGTLKVRGPATAKKYKQREVCRVYGANRATVDLICAAPDMLDALKALLAAWVALGNDTPSMPGFEKTVAEVARAAIAKAEGK